MAFDRHLSRRSVLGLFAGGAALAVGGPAAQAEHARLQDALDRIVVELQCNDRIGLLFRVGRAIRGAGYAITFANVATEQGFALDTFYLTPERGRTAPPRPPEELAAALRGLVS